jgi:hypothetical protein
VFFAFARTQTYPVARQQKRLPIQPNSFLIIQPAEIIASKGQSFGQDDDITVLTCPMPAWTRATVHQVLTNPKYIGANIYNRRSFKLKHRRVNNPTQMWIWRDSAIDYSPWEQRLFGWNFSTDCKRTTNRGRKIGFHACNDSFNICDECAPSFRQRYKMTSLWRISNPISSSYSRIWRLMAGCETCSLSAALRKCKSRATVSTYWSFRSGGRESMETAFEEHPHFRIGHRF